GGGGGGAGRPGGRAGHHGRGRAGRARPPASAARVPRGEGRTACRLCRAGPNRGGPPGPGRGRRPSARRRPPLRIRHSRDPAARLPAPPRPRPLRLPRPLPHHTFGGELMTTFGLLIFDGAEELDFVGRWEVFTAAAMIQAETGAAADICVTVAERGNDPVCCAKGLRVLADHSFADHPPLDVLLVPGGVGARRGGSDTLIGCVR